MSARRAELQQLVHTQSFVRCQVPAMSMETGDMRLAGRMDAKALCAADTAVEPESMLALPGS